MYSSLSSSPYRKVVLTSSPEMCQLFNAASATIILLSQTIPLVRIFHCSQYPQPERSLWLQAWLSFGHLTLSQMPISFLLFYYFWVDLLTCRHCICKVIQALCDTLYAIPPVVHLAFVECPLRSIHEF